MSRLSLLAALLVALPVSAQASLTADIHPGVAHTCILTADAHDHREPGDPADRPTFEQLDAISAAWRRTANPTSHVVVTEGPTTTFIVTYTGFDAFPEAQASYQSAVDIWAAHLSSAVPIRVTASFEPLGATVLGSAGPRLIRNWTDGTLPPQRDVWYPFAMADAIAGTELAAGVDDITSRFSSNFTNWYFGTDGAPANTQYDFRSVVLHELGHGLGFSGSGRWDDGVTAGRCDGVLNNGCWGRSGFTSPQVFDLLVESFQGAMMVDTSAYDNPSPELGTLVRSNSAWINSPRVVALPGTPFPRGRLYVPAAWQQGSSFSHWNEATYTANTTNALMTPQIGQGEHYDSPGPLTCAFFADMGWPLGPGCALFVADESGPAATAASLRLAGANPFSGATQLRLTLDAPQAVEAALYDVTGRRVQVLYSGEAPAGTLTLTVRGERLAAGVYAVRATVGGETSEVRVVHTR